MAVPVRADFLLDPDIVFLNNGSFGAVALPVWNGQPSIRVSFAAYNNEADSDSVVAAVKSTLR